MGKGEGGEVRGNRTQESRWTSGRDRLSVHRDGVRPESREAGEWQETRCDGGGDTAGRVGADREAKVSKTQAQEREREQGQEQERDQDQGRGQGQEEREQEPTRERREG